MTEQQPLLLCPYASITNAQLPLLKVAAALYFGKLVILDPVGASWATIGADHHAREAVKLLQDAGILQTVTLAEALSARDWDALLEQMRSALTTENEVALYIGHN